MKGWVSPGRRPGTLRGTEQRVVGTDGRLHLTGSAHPLYSTLLLPSRSSQCEMLYKEGAKMTNPSLRIKETNGPQVRGATFDGSTELIRRWWTVGGEVPSACAF